jgi:membrane protease YdiL (CAAX protease family)
LSQLGICQYGLMFAVQALWVNCFYPVCLLLRFGADEEYSSVLLSLMIWILVILVSLAYGIWKHSRPNCFRLKSGTLPCRFHIILETLFLGSCCHFLVSWRSQILQMYCPWYPMIISGTFSLIILFFVQETHQNDLNGKSDTLLKEPSSELVKVS